MPETAFHTTRWTLVIQAAEGSQEGQSALESLCQTYWYPIYAFLRRSGHSPPDAQDLTQGYFMYLLEREHLKNVLKDKGRFRSYLLAGAKHFATSERRKSDAIKRGGGVPHLSIDEMFGEERYGQEPADSETPESIYAKSWATTVLDHVLETLAGEFHQLGKAHLFESLRPHLVQEPNRDSHAAIAERHGLTVGAVTMFLYRMRERYGDLLRTSVADTVASPNEIEDEIRFLINAVS